MNKTPAALGYRMPAEWEPHAATWLAWPHNKNDWPGKFAPIKWVYCEIIRNLVDGETVRLVVDSERDEAEAGRMLRRVGVGFDNIDFVPFKTNRGWMRDTGPIFVTKLTARGPSKRAIVDLHFNAWAKYLNHDLDSQIASLAAEKYGHKLFDAHIEGRPFVLEGGAIDVNGRGTLITTEECLLDPVVQVRNPGLSKSDTERALRDHLGVSNVLWLGRGIAGDDTHGHIDDLCRFVSVDTVVLCRETKTTDENYRVLEENRERLEGYRLENRKKLKVIDLPMPAPVYLDGQRLPASYANFYVANKTVLVPTFNDPNDRVALGILSELFPELRVVGIHAVDLVWGLGTIHCMSQQEPAIER